MINIELCTSRNCSTIIQYLVIESTSPTFAWHALECETWGLWTVQIFCCIHRMDKHKADHPCGFGRGCEGWNLMKSVFRSLQKYTEKASRQCEPIGVASVWNFLQRLCHIRHIHGPVGRGCANVFALRNCHETFLYTLYEDKLLSGELLHRYFV